MLSAEYDTTMTKMKTQNINKILVTILIHVSATRRLDQLDAKDRPPVIIRYEYDYDYDD